MLDPGDETHRHGDYVKVEDSGTVEPGEPIDYNGQNQAVPLKQGDQYVGVYQVHGRPGKENCTVKLQGTVLAYVASGTTGSDNLGSPDTANGEPEGAFGTKDDQNVVALEDAYEYKNTGRYVAEVLLR